VVGELKSKSAVAILSQDVLELPDDCRVVKNGIERWAFWQPRCYDHNCRSREKVLEKINYCHNNPIKRGLAAEPGLWRWSSYNWYVGVEDVPLQMDSIDNSS